MAIINIVNNDNILLINESFKCLTLHSKGFLIPRAIEPFFCGRAELTVKVASNLPPLLFMNCHFPVVVEALNVVSVDQYGTTYKFVVFGGEIDSAFEYYLFTTPSDITNEKIGAMAMWDGTGQKIFDSALKYMSLKNIITIPNNEVNEGTGWGKIENLDPSRTYAFTNAVKIGYDYCLRWATFLTEVYWRVGCYISNDNRSAIADFVMIYSGTAEGLENVPTNGKESLTEKGMMLVIDVTNY